jgi:transcription elongation factor GreA
MAEIEHELKHAIVIKQNQDISRVDLGHVITVNLGGKEKIYTLLGSTETDPLSGKISQHSPIGKAIFGKQVGDVITIDLPKGPTQIQILAIALPE